MSDDPKVPALVIGAGETQVRLKATPMGEPMVVLDRLEDGEFVPVIGLVFTDPDVLFHTLEALGDGLAEMVGGRKRRGREH